MAHAPRIAIVHEDGDRARELSELLAGAGLAPRAFTSPSSAASLALAGELDAMLVDHAIREVPLRDLQADLTRRLGRAAPPFVVLTGRLHEMPIPERSRYVAVLPVPVTLDALLAALESAVARRQHALVV